MVADTFPRSKQRHYLEAHSQTTLTFYRVYKCKCVCIFLLSGSLCQDVVMENVLSERIENKTKHKDKNQLQLRKKGAFSSQVPASPGAETHQEQKRHDTTWFLSRAQPVTLGSIIDERMCQNAHISEWLAYCRILMTSDGTTEPGVVAHGCSSATLIWAQKPKKSWVWDQPGLRSEKDSPPPQDSAMWWSLWLWQLLPLFLSSSC